MYTNTDYNIHGTFPLLLSPLADSLLLPLLTPFYLLGNPPSCDRIHPPWSQVACKLTSPFPTLFPIPPPSKFPGNPASLVRNRNNGYSAVPHLARDANPPHALRGTVRMRHVRRQPDRSKRPQLFCTEAESE